VQERAVGSDGEERWGGAVIMMSGRVERWGAAVARSGGVERWEGIGGGEEARSGGRE
jgi:hypothetical protein